MKDNKALDNIESLIMKELPEHMWKNVQCDFITLRQALTKEVSNEGIYQSKVEPKPSECYRTHCVLENDTCINYMGVNMCALNNKVDTPTLPKKMRNLNEEERKVFEDYYDSIEVPTLPNFTDIDIEKLWEIEDEVTVKENWKELIKVISKIKQALSVPTKSAKEMFEELGYELVKDRSFPNLVSYVKKTECYERIEICFNVPSKTYSKELNDKVWAITNEEHQAITQQLKELEK